MTMNREAEDYDRERKRYMDAAQSALGHTQALVRSLIELEFHDVGRTRNRFQVASEPVVKDLVRRLYPMQLFVDEPGVIVCTASKSQFSVDVCVLDPRAQGPSPKWEKFSSLSHFLACLNTRGNALGTKVSRSVHPARSVMFVDEEEESYWYLFKHRKSTVNAEGKHDLNVVITEFFRMFDLTWPFAFERQGDHRLAEKIYSELAVFARLSAELYREIEKVRESTQIEEVSPARRLKIFRHLLEREGKGAQWKNRELNKVLALIEVNDGHANFRMFQAKARVLTAMRSYVTASNRSPARSSYDAYRAMSKLLLDKKFFCMDRSSFGELLDQPHQTFFSATASVMDTDLLKRVEVIEDAGHTVLRLKYREETTDDKAYTLLDYLKLLLRIARLLGMEGKNALPFPDDAVVRYPELARFRSDCRKLFVHQDNDAALAEHSYPDELISDEFIWEAAKSVVRLEESQRQPNEYNVHADLALTVTITSLREAPEEDLVRTLGTNNGIFLMSATGGLLSASSGSFNLHRLQKRLDDLGGLLIPMDGREREAVAATAVKFMRQRDRIVRLVDDKDAATSFHPSRAYRGLRAHFDDAWSKARLRNGSRASLSRHKRSEVDGLVATLDKVLTTPIRSGMVLCQSVRNAREHLQALAKVPSSAVKQCDNDGHHFEISPQRLPGYRSQGATEKVVIILYRAERFRKRTKGKIAGIDDADDQGALNDELVQALDVREHKLLLWSAYGSASRGLNFLVRDKTGARDFELYCLLNDPYYTHHTRPSERGFSIEMFQAFLQVLRDREPGWALMSRADVLYEFSRYRHRRLQTEHQIDITRQTSQALGRGERRPNLRISQHLYVSRQAADTILLGLRHAPELEERASPALQCVVQEIRADHARSPLFATDAARAKHFRKSVKLALAFTEFTSQTPLKFRRSKEARRIWAALFSDNMFTAPHDYLSELRKVEVPAEFVDAAFLKVPYDATLFTKTLSTSAGPIEVITDWRDGEDSYEWVARLAPSGLIERLPKALCNALQADRATVAQGNERLVPQPWFVREIMKGYLGERAFEEYVAKNPAGRRFVPYQPRGRYQALLYQLYDYYYENSASGELFAVDVKNWTRNTDSMKREELKADAVDKHARLSSLFPGRTIRCVYVNLQGAPKPQVESPASGSIRFMSIYVRSADEWIVNRNLTTSLRGN
jgi:hypothetical protein